MLFEKIYIELSDICGLKCDFCPSVKGVRGVMSVENFAKIAEKIAKKAKIYTFHLLGDALILPNLDEYLAVANSHQMILELTTSGFYMNEKNQNLLLQSENIRQINFSLMAFLAQKKLDFTGYFTPIMRFIRTHLALKKQSFVNLRLWNLDEDFKNIAVNEELYCFLEKEFGVKIQRKNVKNRLANRIILHQNKRFCWANLNDKIIHTKGFCYGLSKQIGILSNAQIVPCCMDSGGVIALGNILEQNLDEILNSQRAIQMKKALQKGEFIEPLCQSCEFGRTKSQQNIFAKP